MTAKFDLISIVVTDMAASLAFYRRLGLDIPDDVDTGQPHVEVTLPGGIRLAWDSADMVKSIDPEWRAPQDSPRGAWAFLCDDADDVDRVYADLVGAGYHGHREPWDAFWGQRYAVVHDPDGNAVDLFARLKPE